MPRTPPLPGTAPGVGACKGRGCVRGRGQRRRRAQGRIPKQRGRQKKVHHRGWTRGGREELGWGHRAGRGHWGWVQGGEGQGKGTHKRVKQGQRRLQFRKVTRSRGASRCPPRCFRGAGPLPWPPRAARPWGQQGGGVGERGGEQDRLRSGSLGQCLAPLPGGQRGREHEPAGAVLGRSAGTGAGAARWARRRI